MQEIKPLEECFIRFKTSIVEYSIPEIFNYPFNYEPHPLCQLAAREVQMYLGEQTDWVHDFGIDHYVDGTNIGKMFGVLLVRNKDNEIGYLAAFSGKMAGTNLLPYFVPPIVDLLSANSFYRVGEDEISAINRQIQQLEQQPEYLEKRLLYETIQKQSVSELEAMKLSMKNAKMLRDELRASALMNLNEPEALELGLRLNNESINQQYEYKQRNKYWRSYLEEILKLVAVFEQEIQRLKDLRKNMSASLQQRMFDQYNFLNSKGEVKNVMDVFKHIDQGIPPAGAGDCAGPKMLQYAYYHQLQPLAMAEFWWGQSPKSEVRKHGFFYPACKSKCEPILGFMLQGIQVEQNPLLKRKALMPEPQILYDDEAIIIINKPAEYLSVPGKSDVISVYDFIKERYPDADGPLIVHRLDMSTSGLMVVAKHLDVYHNLQNQFLQRRVKKRYVALLEGIIDKEEGVIELPLRVDLDNRPRQLVCYEYGKPALTRWKLIRCEGQRTRVAFYPITGRTHQLRVHAAHSAGLNCPIVGDDLYGQKAQRLCLHAEYLEFTHPVTQKIISFTIDAEF